MKGRWILGILLLSWGGGLGLPLWGEAPHSLKEKAGKSSLYPVSLSSAIRPSASAFRPLNNTLAPNYLESSLVEGQAFHWHTPSPVIRVYVSPRSTSSSTRGVLEALRVWETLLEGTLHFIQVETRETADIEIDWAEEAIPSHVAEFANATCEKTIRAQSEIIHVRIKLGTVEPYTHRPFGDTQIQQLALHELGHAFGLNHSSEPADIMYPGLQEATPLRPSERDINTLKLLYLYPADAGRRGTALTAAPGGNPHPSQK